MSKQTRIVDYNLKDLFRYYKKTTEKSVNYSTFVKVIKLFNKYLVDELYDGTFIRLPHKLGSLYIQKYKPKYKFDADGNLTNAGQVNMIDYKATKELWKEHPELAHKQRIFYENNHSDGFKFKIKWKCGSIKNILIYNFIPAKSLKRNLAEFIRNNPNKDYYDN